MKKSTPPPPVLPGGGVRVSPAARRQLDRMVQGRESAPQALWVRVEGSQVSPDTVGLALVDRPDPVPDGYHLQESWTVPVLVDDAHAIALRGARVEYDDAGRNGAFRVRLANEIDRPQAAPPAPESGCMSCSSAALPELEALRASMGLAAPASGSAFGRAGAGRGPALPILGQATAAEVCA